jgi:PAS domain S-box-containing protein
MLTPFRVAPGIIVDGRVVVVALAGVFDGPASGLVAAALVMAFRTWLGGVGTIPGEGAILTACLLGALIHWRWRARVRDFGPKQFLLLGATLVASGMLWTLALPDPLVARRVFRILAFPVGLGFPVATLLLGTLLSHQIRRREAEEALAKVRQDLEQQVFERTADLSRSNALLQDEIAERKRAEGRLAKLNECLLSFGADPNENINRLVALCGEELGATCALYNRLEGGKLCAWGQWNVPADFTPVDTPDGHICYDVIQGRQGHVCVIRNLPETAYAHTDPNVLRYGLKTYLGKPVWFAEAFVGSLCVLYCEDRAPSDEDLKLLGIVASAIAVEEERRRAKGALQESEERFRRLSEASFEGIIFHEEGNIIDANEAFATMFGYGLSEVIGKNALDFATPELREEALGHIRDGSEEPYDGVATRKDGSTFPIETRGKNSLYKGRTIRLTAVRDITERKRAEEELRVRTRQLEALRAISVEITRELDLTAVLQLILQRAMELVGVTSGGISLWDETAQVLVPRTWHGLGARVGEVYIRLGEGVAGVVAERREGMIVNDYQTSPYVLPDVLECLEISAILAEPLMYGERLVGVLILFNMETGRSFTEQDRQTLALFATQAAIAIENARLHQTTVQRAKQLATLNELMRKLTTLLDPPQLAREILQAVQDLIPNAVSRLWEYVEGAGELHLVAGVGLQAAEVGYKLRLRGGEGLLGTAIATRQPVISPDVVRDPRFVNKTWGAAEGLVSSIALPLVYGERVTGGLGISTRQPHDFTDEEVNLLQSFAAQAAIALENARLFEQVRDGRERLQALSRRLVEVQEAERRNIARELHDEIGQLLTGLKLLLEMSARVRPEKVMARLGEAQSLANELMMRVRELSLDLRPAMLDDLGILPALLWHFERFTELSKVQVLFRHSGLEGQRFSPEVETAAYRIVQEALTNVARHAKVAEVAVRLWVDENALDLRIEDRGAGFDPEATLSAAASSGLAGMRERAALLGGRLTVTSTPGSGTQVMAELPLAGRFEKRRKPR